MRHLYMGHFPGDVYLSVGDLAVKVFHGPIRRGGFSLVLVVLLELLHFVGIVGIPEQLVHWHMLIIHSGGGIILIRKSSSFISVLGKLSLYTQESPRPREFNTGDRKESSGSALRYGGRFIKFLPAVQPPGDPGCVGSFPVRRGVGCQVAGHGQDHRPLCPLGQLARLFCPPVMLR